MDFITQRHGLVATLAPLGNWPDKGIKFMKSEEVKEIGQILIDKFRPDLKGFKIEYIFKQKAGKSGSMTTLGQAKKENDLQKVLHSLTGVVIIGFDTWKELEDDAKWRLVFHELAHFELDEKGDLSIANHPVEEFPEIVKIFGLGNDAQIDFIHAYQKFCHDYKGIDVDTGEVKDEESDN